MECSEREFSRKKHRPDNVRDTVDYIMELPKRSMDSYASKKRAINNSRKKKNYAGKTMQSECYLTLPQTVFTKS